MTSLRVSNPVKGEESTPSGSMHFTCDATYKGQANEAVFHSKITSTSYKALKLSENVKNGTFQNRNDKSYSWLRFQSKLHLCEETPFANVLSLLTVAANQCRLHLFFYIYLFFVLFLLLPVSATPVLRSELLTLNPSVADRNRTRDTQVEFLDTESLSFQTVNKPRENIDVPSSKSKRSSGKKKRKRERKRKGKSNRNKNGKKKRKKSGKGKRKFKKNQKIKNSSDFTKLFFHSPNHPITNTANYRKGTRLYNKNGVSFHLAVWRNGTVSGEKSDLRSPYSILKITAVGRGGIVAMFGVKSKKYICVNRRGKVKAKRHYRAKWCQFHEDIIANHQNTYESLSCRKCFLNVNKKGRIKRLKKVNPHLIEYHFLPFYITGRPKRKALEMKQAKTITTQFGEGGTVAPMRAPNTRRKQNLSRRNAVIRGSKKKKRPGKESNRKLRDPVGSRKRTKKSRRRTSNPKQST